MGSQYHQAIIGAPSPNTLAEQQLCPRRHGATIDVGKIDARGEVQQAT